MRIIGKINFAGNKESCDDDCVSSCKPYWVEIDTHCYMWENFQLSWHEAEEYCRKQGGHLASITSKATNDKISAEFKTKDHETKTNNNELLIIQNNWFKIPKKTHSVKKRERCLINFL